MSLREYARKRRFGQTPEPADDAGVGRRGHRPTFVVQLHHARARHYDFRLEMDGTLKSWAVPKGPSFRVGEKRLAVEVEDHPLGYASFEGDIPEGHYGAGHVDRFDHGVWSADGDPLASLAAGKLDFVLHGEKLNGAWKLVRTAKPARQPQWLLIKRQDEYAHDGEADDLLDARGKPLPAKAPAVRRAAKKKTPAKRAKRTARRPRKTDWRAEAQALEGARALRGKSLPAPQLAKLVSEPPKGEDWLHELKWDGYRLLVRIENGEAKLRSRKNLDWTADYPEIVAALEALGVEQGDFDGELIALDEKGRDDFSSLQRTIEGSANATLRYVLFDLPSLEGVDLSNARLIDRKRLLERLLEGADPILAYSQHVVGHGDEVFAASAKQGMEGIISKHVGGRYYSGRSASWLKSKHAQSDEFVVVGYTAPRNSRTGFGSLLLATRDHGALRYVGRVGTGFDEAMLRSLNKTLRKLERKQATLELPKHVPLSLGRVTWVEPRLIVEIEYRGWAKEGLLRQGSFVRLREDKAMKDIGGDTQPRISSPDKRVFPESGITKQEVADYYAAIAPRILPELARRPLSLLRCPDGIAKQCFFQKHHAGTLGANVHAVPIKEKDGGKDDYLYIEDAEGLLDLVQMNTLEMHPWGSRIDDVEHPDTLVFDLDPGPGVKWSAVAAAARDVRDRLLEIGLKSFLRTSGGKGLHVVLPIKPGPSWEEAKDFCEAFAVAMATQAPEKYVSTASKAKRKGVIFIDWLRNGRGATSVVSWSLRARAGAPVAMPLRWDELSKVKSGADFDMKKAMARSARLRKPIWEDWNKAAKQKLVSLR